MRTIMKERFMQIGTLEEAEFNRVVSQPRLADWGRLMLLSLLAGTGITDRWVFGASKLLSFTH